MSDLQAAWTRVGRALGVTVHTNVPIALGPVEMVAPVVVRDFGAAKGMVLVADYDDVREHADALVAAGYGYSCIDPPGRL